MGSSPQRIGRSTPKKVRLLYARKVSLFSFLVALPGIIVSSIFIWQESWSIQSKLGLFILMLFAWGLLAMAPGVQAAGLNPLIAGNGGFGASNLTIDGVSGNDAGNCQRQDCDQS